MRKIMLLMIVMCITLSIAGCSNAEENYGTKQEDSQGEKNGSYEITSDLEVITGFQRYDNINDICMIVKNNGNQMIKDFTLNIVGYDALGNAVNLETGVLYETKEFKTVNLMPGCTVDLYSNSYNTSFTNRNSSSKYYEGFVSKIVYKDGTEWNSGGVDTWATETTSKFSLEEYKKKIAEMAHNTQSPYLEIVNSKNLKWNKGAKYDRYSELDITVKNIGDKPIKKVVIIAMSYDDDGFPIEERFSRFVRNSNWLLYEDANVAIGKTTTLSRNPTFENNCNNYILQVYSVEFTDGTTWVNENAIPWILYNEEGIK